MKFHENLDILLKSTGFLVFCDPSTPGARRTAPGGERGERGARGGEPRPEWIGGIERRRDGSTGVLAVDLADPGWESWQGFWRELWQEFLQEFWHGSRQGSRQGFWRGLCRVGQRGGVAAGWICRDPGRRPAGALARV